MADARFATRCFRGRIAVPLRPTCPDYAQLKTAFGRRLKKPKAAGFGPARNRQKATVCLGSKAANVARIELHGSFTMASIPQKASLCVTHATIRHASIRRTFGLAPMPTICGTWRRRGATAAIAYPHTVVCKWRSQHERTSSPRTVSGAHPLGANGCSTASVERRAGQPFTHCPSCWRGVRRRSDWLDVRRMRPR